MDCISKLRSTHVSSRNGRRSSVTLSASILEKSNTSLTMERRVLLARTTMSLISAWSSLRPGSSAMSSEPAMMALRGVRISWLVLARNAVFAATAASLRRFAACNKRRDSRSRVTSRAVSKTTDRPTAPTGRWLNSKTTRRRPSYMSTSSSSRRSGAGTSVRRVSDSKGPPAELFPPSVSEFPPSAEPPSAVTPSAVPPTPRRRSPRWPRAFAPPTPNAGGSSSEGSRDAGPPPSPLKTLDCDHVLANAWR